MKTEELEKKLKISKNTCIHCPTLELAKQVLSIFHQLGLKWCNEKHYIRNTNWDKHEENTLYFPFDGLYSSLKFADLTSNKVINAKEFIALHTEKEKFDLENYEPKGDLQGFLKEIIACMLNYQDVSVFERMVGTAEYDKGFTWDETKEGKIFWKSLIGNKDFNLFFKKYPKQNHQELKNNKNMQENNKKEDNSQEFRIGDKVIDIVLYEVGVVQDIDYSPDVPYRLSVEFKSGFKSYTINGCFLPECKNPQLLHYRDNYDYSIINFNNLPERQKPKRWRAKKGGIYYAITAPAFKIGYYFDDYVDSDNEVFEIGNYFQTEEEAQEVADKLNKYFQELIQTKK